MRRATSFLHVWPPRLLGLSLVLLALIASGCSHYRLGTGTERNFTTLHVAPVANEALVPQAVALVSREVRYAFLRDGRVQLVDSPEEADAVLEITLANYGRTMTTAREGDTGLARKFDLTLEADVVLIERGAAEPLIERRRISVTRQAFTDGDGFRLEGRPAPGGQLPAEYQTLPLLAQQLADRVTHAVLDTW